MNIENDFMSLQHLGFAAFIIIKGFSFNYFMAFFVFKCYSLFGETKKQCLTCIESIAWIVIFNPSSSLSFNVIRAIYAFLLDIFLKTILCRFLNLISHSSQQILQY